jgi:hypothetical protein
MMKPILFAALFAIFLQTELPAQSQGGPDSAGTAKKKTDTAFVMSKSPWGAVLRSAIFPGWGQFYNESYWKIPIVLGLSGFLVGGVISEHSGYADYRDRYAASITSAMPSGDLRLKQFREYYRANRDTYAWWLLVTYLVQIADAFVDAHLYDFDVSGTTQAGIVLLPGRGLTLKISW